MNLKDVVQLLGNQGITKVTIRYSGSGDSGDIEEFNYFVGEKEVKLEDLVADPLKIADKVGKKASDNLKGKKTKPITHHEFDLPPQDIIESALNQSTDLIDGDWYNNEGGQGTITINCKTGKVEIDAEFNYNEVRTESQEVQL